MIDLKNYNVELKKVLTQKEFDEKIENGLIRSGEIVEVYDNYGNARKVEYVCILPPNWKPTIKELQEKSWKNKNLIRNIYKYQEYFWSYMKENNIIPEDILNEIESE